MPVRRRDRRSGPSPPRRAFSPARTRSSPARSWQGTRSATSASPHRRRGCRRLAVGAPSLPLVPLQVTGPGGRVVYVVASARALPELTNLGFDIAFLGPPACPSTPTCSSCATTRPRNRASCRRGGRRRGCSRSTTAASFVASTAEGLVVALPPERSLGEFHLENTRHGHTLKLVPDPALLAPRRGCPSSCRRGAGRAGAAGGGGGGLRSDRRRGPRRSRRALCGRGAALDRRWRADPQPPRRARGQSARGNGARGRAGGPGRRPPRRAAAPRSPTAAGSSTTSRPSSRAPRPSWSW